MTEESITFDRAAGFYDRTRSLDPDIMDRITSMLAAELRGKDGRALEIGVGTGRIALPLHNAGIPLAGIDLSAPMLRRLIQNAGGAAPIPLAVADATLLPFASGVFAAGIACHVFHLIPGWQRAITELIRVTRPGGTLLVDVGGWPRDDLYHDIMRRFLSDAGLPDRRRGVQDRDEMDEALSAHGAPGRRLGLFELSESKTYAEVVDDLERGTYSLTWDASDEERSRAAAKLREWLSAEVGDLGASFEIPGEIVWTAYDLP